MITITLSYDNINETFQHHRPFSQKKKILDIISTNKMHNQKLF